MRAAVNDPMVHGGMASAARRHLGGVAQSGGLAKFGGWVAQTPGQVIQVVKSRRNDVPGRPGARPGGRLDAQESAKVTRTWTDPTKGLMLSTDWFAQWQRTTARLRQSTEARDEQLFRRYVLPRLGRVQLATIDQLAVAEW